MHVNSGHVLKNAATLFCNLIMLKRFSDAVHIIIALKSSQARVCSLLHVTSGHILKNAATILNQEISYTNIKTTRLFIFMHIKAAGIVAVHLLLCR